MVRRALASLVVALLTLSMLPRAAVGADGATRVYLLASDAGELHWSTDPADPELGVKRVTRTCGASTGLGGEAGSCLPGIAGSRFSYNLFFGQAALLDAPVSWSAAAPLRFRVEMQVSSPLPYQVVVGFLRGADGVDSDPAVEVAPGVFEGTLRQKGTLAHDVFNSFAVRVLTAAPRIQVELSSGGASWIDLPREVGARAVPALLAADDYRPAPSSLVTDESVLSFNDDDWTVQQFAGDLGERRTFSLPLARDGAALLVWVELATDPAVYDVWLGHLPREDSANLAEIYLRRGTEQVAAGFHTVGLLPAPAGSYELTVARGGANNGATAYKGYALAIYGERTLARLRMRLSTTFLAARFPGTGMCERTGAPVPQTSAVTTMLVDLDWVSPSPVAQGWTPAYFLDTVGDAPCGGMATGDRVRFTFPGARLWGFAAAPANHYFVSSFDSLIDIDVRYTYAPS